MGVARTTARQRIAVGTLAAVIAGGASWVWGPPTLRDRDGVDAQAPARTTSTTAPPTTTTASPVTTTSTVTSTTVPVAPGADGVLELGESGPEVAVLQVRLDELGYWHGGSDGEYGQLTRQAVMAFQKAEGLARDGEAGPATQAALVAAVRPAPHDPSGNHLEIDLARQILFVVEGGKTRWVLNTSTGNGEAYPAPSGGTAVATTPTGWFAVERQIDGIRRAPLGTLYRPKYIVGGIAIHGSGEVPARPASHGCARVTNGAMDHLWSSGLADLGTPVLVH
jgi:peptidoglycan hydrolase-like protein with peptidoglycan-binding domain